MNLMKRAQAPTSIAVQVTLLVLAAGLVAAALAALSLASARPPPWGPPGEHSSAVRIGAVLNALVVLPPPQQRDVALAYMRPDFSVALVDRTPPPHGEPTPAERAFWPQIERETLPGLRLVDIEDQGEGRRKVVIALEDGRAAIFQVVTDTPFFRPPQSLWPRPSVLAPIVFVVVVTLLLLFWTVRRLVAPLRQFAGAVEKFEGQGPSEFLPERGPTELRAATRAFNDMRLRVLRLVEDRTKTMAAISHDLRTPLTRLRLRAEETIEGEPQRRMLEDIRQMDALISSALTYLQEGAVGEVAQKVDLPSIVETICDQFSDTGHAVQYEGPAQLTALCRPTSLGRAITNLVDNATKFGSAVVVRLEVRGQSVVCIDVEDDGPGISDSEKRRVLEPFYRGDAARQGTAGFGLGLAIAQNIAHNHGGTLSLHDRAPRGLIARISFPLTGPVKI